MIGAMLLTLLGTFPALLPGLAQAQVINPHYVSFLPDPPMADRPMSMHIVVTPCATGYFSDEDAVVEVTGNRIEVTLLHTLVPVCPPHTFVPYDIVIPLGTYPAGDYEVLVIGRDRNDPPGLRALFLATLTVLPQDLALPAPASIPVSSPVALVLLCFGLLMLGVWRVRTLG